MAVDGVEPPFVTMDHRQVVGLNGRSSGKGATTAQGRDATVRPSDSSPESGQWGFASRKQTFITEC